MTAKNWTKTLGHDRTRSAEDAYFSVFERLTDVTEDLDVEAYNWTHDAACLGMDPELFFNEQEYGRSIAIGGQRERLARLCDSCDVKPDCLDHAIVWKEHGWWAGTTRVDRKRMHGN